MVDRRPSIFALAGAVLVGTAAFLLSPTLIDGYVACGSAVGDIADGLGCAPNRTTVLGIFQLSDTEMVVWGTIVGTLAGALLGLLTAWLTSPSVERRTRFLIFGTLIGVAAGFFYGLSIEDRCIQDGEFLACRRKWFFGSEIAALAAVALWMLVGGIAGYFVGWTSARLTRRGEPAHA